MNAPKHCTCCGSTRVEFIGIFVPRDHRLPRSVYRLCEDCYPPTREMLDRIERKAEANYARYSTVEGNA